MQPIAITNVTMIDGTGADTFRGDVLVDGNPIVEVTHAPNKLNGTAQRIINGNGRFLMPGMTESHTHFSWNDQPSLSAIQ